MFKQVSFVSCVMSGYLAAAGCLAGDLAGPDPAAAAPGPGVTVTDVVKPIPVRPAPPSGAATGDAMKTKPARAPDALAPADTFQWTVHMTIDQPVLWPTEFATVTVTANADVGPTPFFLRIWYWDGTQGVYLADCATGTTCSGTVTRPDAGSFTFWGMVEDVNHANQALTSADVIWHGAGTALSVNPPTNAVGATTTVTATTNQDVGPSPFYIELFDATTQTLLAECGFGRSCSAQVTPTTVTTHAYQAFLSRFSTAFPPPGIVDTTPVSYATWGTGGWSVDLTADSITQSTATVTATASADVGPTPFYIELFDESTGLIALCGSGSTCSVPYQPSQSGSNLVAFVAQFSSSLVPPGAQGNSATVTSTLVPPPR